MPRPVRPRGVDSELPRLGLATCSAGPEPSVASLAMLAGLTQWRWRVQHFRTRACPTATEAVGQVTGLPGRHLDAWLMPAPVCRSLFARAAASAELSLVEGTLECAMGAQPFPTCDHPGDLGPIAEALDLPVVAVVSCRGSDSEAFHLPRFPEGVDAILLDELADPEHLPRLRRLVHWTTGLPVVGAIEAMPGVRAALERVPRDRHLPDDLIDELARSFLKHADLTAIDELARCRPFRRPTAGLRALGPRTPTVPRGLRAGRGVRPLLSRHDRGARGAGRRPRRVLTVARRGLAGTGQPGDDRLRLAGPPCGRFGLEPQHDRRAGGARLPRASDLFRGRGDRLSGASDDDPRPLLPGAGILPFDAELVSDTPPPAPVSRRLLHDCWLGSRGTMVRGYKSDRWRLIPGIEPFECPACFGALSAEGDWFYHHHAVGSLLHLHLGALPEVVAAFAGPHRPSLRRPTARGLAERDADRFRDHDEGRDAPEV